MTPYLWLVSIIIFGTGLCAGYMMHRSDFCMAGAFRDLFLFRSATLARPLVLLVITSMLLFETADRLGWLPYAPFPWFGPPAGVNLIGGLVFGIGMVLAGGCVVGVLYKMGSGSVIAGIAFAGLLVGSLLYAEIHPWWSRLAARTTFAGEARTLPQWLGIPSAPLVWFLGIAGAVLCWVWWQRGTLQTRHAAEGHIQPWLTAMGLAVLGLVSALTLGLPMGVTTTYAKLAAWLESGLFPEHVARLGFFSHQSTVYAFPYEGLVRTGGAGPVFDVVAMVQLPLILGIVCGAFISAWRLAEFKPHWHLPRRQVGMVFVGGVIMALGSRMAPGCNVWHVMGGLPVLTLQSILFVIGLIPGAWIGSHLLQRVLVGT